MTLEIYTDGSCSPNPGPGGAGVLFVLNDEIIQEIIHTGGKTTNNRMELMAVILAYQGLEKGQKATIYTDSQYVRNGLNNWLSGWIKKGWLNSTGKEVKNKDLWQQLVKLRDINKGVKVEWIRAHNGHKYNERADALANLGTERSKQNL